MKTLILGTIAFLACAANAQIEIQVDGVGPDVSGTIVDFNVDFSSPNYDSPLFFVTNNTGVDQQIRITRVKQNVPANWNDAVAWGSLGLPATGDVYTTPSSIGNPAPTIINGTYLTTDGYGAILRGFIFPEGNSAVAIYMYYVTDNNGNYLDSVGMKVNYVLGLDEELPEMNISISPNPTSSYITIECEGMKSGKLELIDVLGNTILTEEIIGSSKTLDLSTFKNGMYFVRLETDDYKMTTRKVSLKH